MARKNDIAISIGTHRGRPFELAPDTRARHFYIVGQTGTGKSGVLLNMIAQDLAVPGRGVCVVDPHGDLAMQALSMLPLERAPQLIYIDPSDLARPIGLNVIDNVEPDRRATVVEAIVATFIHVYGEVAIGSRSQQVLRNSLRALMATAGMSLLAIPKLLTHAGFRQRIMSRIDDPVCLAYWRDQYELLPQRQRVETISPLLNKLDPLLGGNLRNLIAQPSSSIDIRRILDTGQVLIVNLSKGAVGEGTSALIGAFIVTAIANAALSRADLPPDQRRPFFLYADEFYNYATTGFHVILSEARKYNLALTLAHQHTGQLSEELRQSVLGNAGSILSLRIGAEDAPLIARHLGLGEPHPNPSALIELANFEAWGKFLIDGTVSEPTHIELAPPPKPRHQRAHRLIELSRAQFGRDRATVEEEVRRFLAGS